LHSHDVTQIVRFYKAFERTGMLISANGEGDERIKPEGLAEDFWQTIRQAPTKPFIISLDSDGEEGDEGEDDGDGEASGDEGDNELEWSDEDTEQDAPPSPGFSLVEAMIADLDEAEDSGDQGEVQFVAEQPQPRFADLRADRESHLVAQIFARKQTEYFASTGKTQLTNKEYDKIEAEARAEAFQAQRRTRRGTSAARAGRGFYSDNF
jgi:hypothetical protein